LIIIQKTTFSLDLTKVMLVIVEGATSSTVILGQSIALYVKEENIYNFNKI